MTRLIPARRDPITGTVGYAVSLIAGELALGRAGRTRRFTRGAVVFALHNWETYSTRVDCEVPRAFLDKEGNRWLMTN